MKSPADWEGRAWVFSGLLPRHLHEVAGFFHRDARGRQDGRFTSGQNAAGRELLFAADAPQHLQRGEPFLDNPLVTRVPR